MSTALFVSGTDTGIGKTRISVGLLQAAQRAGWNAVGMKPLASGCTQTVDGWRNDDALQLLAASSVPRPHYEQVNPLALPLPIAPHLAARAHGTSIDLSQLHAAFRRLSSARELTVVEGVGGWAVPIGDDRMQADLVREFDLPVLLVVGVRLGAINHALLSARAIRSDGLRLIGWIANRIDPALPAADDAVAAIAERIGVPLLADLAHEADSAGAAPNAAQFDRLLRQTLIRLAPGTPSGAT